MNEGSLEVERPASCHPILAIPDSVKDKATDTNLRQIKEWVEYSDLGIKDSSWPPAREKRKLYLNDRPGYLAYCNLFDGIPIVDRYRAPGDAWESIPVPFNDFLNLVLNERINNVCPVHKLVATPAMLAKLVNENGEKATLIGRLDLALSTTEPSEETTPEELVCYLKNSYGSSSGIF